MDVLLEKYFANRFLMPGYRLKCLRLQPGAVFEIYRFYSNANEYFKIIRLNNLFAISVAVKYFTNFNKDIFIFL